MFNSHNGRCCRGCSGCRCGGPSAPHEYLRLTNICASRIVLTLALGTLSASAQTFNGALADALLVSNTAQKQKRTCHFEVDSSAIVMQDPPEHLFGHLQTGVSHNMPVTPPPTSQAGPQAQVTTYERGLEGFLSMRQCKSLLLASGSLVEVRQWSRTLSCARAWTNWTAAAQL